MMRRPRWNSLSKSIRHSKGGQQRRKKNQSKRIELERVPRPFHSRIVLAEKIGYDTVWQLAKMTSGDHSPFMDVYGYACRQHMKKYGSTVEQLAIIASKNHFNSTLNPNAQYCFEVPVEKVLSDRIVTLAIDPRNVRSHRRRLCFGHFVFRRYS